jgi:Mg2+ and Co2+ transporter CorA
MKKRTIIAELIKRMNESRGSDSGRHAADMYLDECADLYQKMMKSLNSIKILKIEIENYTSPISLASQQQ